MERRRKKVLMILGSVSLALIILCTIFALMFRLKTVDVEFRARAANTNLPAEIQERVFATGEFDVGKNIVFMNFDDNIAKIEKSNPFVKVEQIIRRFPNKVTIYISERIPKYRVKEDSTEVNAWYILDEDFKILDKVSAEDLVNKKVSGNLTYFKQTTEITKETLTFKSAIIGEFVTDVDEIKSYVSKISSGIYAKTKDSTVVRSINYSKVKNQFEVVLRNQGLDNEEGCMLLISGEADLYEKVLAGVVVHLSNNEENTPGVVIEIYKNAAGEYYGVTKK